MVYRIYKITHRSNGKAYVGITRSSIAKRFRQHAYKCNRSGVRLLHRAMKKYGIEAFQLDELCVCPSKRLTAEVEQQLIKAHRTRSPQGYNLTAGGDVGSAHHASTKAKLRKIALARPPISDKTRQRMGKSQKGRRHSAATKAKISKWHLGKKVSEATKAKLRAYWRLRSRRVAS